MDHIIEVRICFFQALSQDLLRVSVRLESVEEQLQSTTAARWTITMEELEKERDMLRKRRDTLDAQLKENRVLSVEVRKEEIMCMVLHYNKIDTLI